MSTPSQQQTTRHIDGITAYRALKKKMSAKSLGQLETMLEKFTPQEVFVLCEFHKQGLHVDVQAIIMAALWYIKGKQDAKARREKANKPKKGGKKK